MGVLAVQVDELGRRLGERRRRCRTAVDVGARPAIGGNHTTQHHLAAFAVVTDETGVDARFNGTGSDDDRIGPCADDEFEGLDEHRLARSGFAGDRRQAVADDEIDGSDDPEALDVQLSEHGAPSCPPRLPMNRLPVGQPELRLQDLVVAVRAEANEPGGLGGWPTLNDIAGVDRQDESAVDGHLGAAMSEHFDLDLFRRVEHECAVEEHVRRDGGEQQRLVAWRHDGPAS